MKSYAGFVYEWTNKINNQKYIGAHLGNENDYYIGANFNFRRDLKLHGTGNFERTILEYVVEANELKQRENYYLELVNAKENPEYYNSRAVSPRSKISKTQQQPERKICPACHQKPIAVNLKRNGITYYRSRCEACLRRQKKLKAQEPLWQKAGYKKKGACDRCGFRARYSAQLVVYHVDGNLKNVETRNLKTICQNCVIEVERQELPWRSTELVPDFKS